MLVFLRAIEDVNKNRVYVHEVFDEASLIEQAKTKKEKSDSLQTRANTQGVSQPPGGIALYKTILNPLFAVKPEDVKVTLDENNEPLASEVRRVEGELGKPGNTALSVDERMGGPAPEVEPGGDLREAGESTLAWLRRKFVHAQTPVFDAVRRVSGNDPLPDRLNVEAAAKNVHGKIRARQEEVNKVYVDAIVNILRAPGMSKEVFDDYAWRCTRSTATG